jgi:glutaredoxin
MRTLAALLLVLIGTATFAEEAYRWVGKDGKIHYSDEPPPPEAKQVEQKRLDASVVAGDKYPYDTRRAMANFPVTLFVTAKCGDACDSARSYLKARGVPYTEKSVVTQDDAAALKKATQSDTVPALLVGSMVSKGYQEAAWDDLMDTAGYPRRNSAAK